MTSPRSLPARRTSARLFATGVLAIALLTGCDALTGEATLDTGAAGVVEPTAVAVAPAATAAPTTVAADPAVAAPTAVSATAVPSGEASPVQDTTGEAGPVEIDDVDVIEDSAPSEAADTGAAAGESEATETVVLEQQSANCMDGRWIALGGQISEYIAAIGETNGVPMSAEGYLIVVLEGGHYTYDAEITTWINIDGFQTTSLVSGVATGSYYYENGFIAATEGASSIEAKVSLNGEVLDASDLAGGFLAEFGGLHEAPFSCNGESRTIFFDVAPGAPRHGIEFTAWDGNRP